MDEEAVMRRTFVLALTALALLGVVATPAIAQAPAPATPQPTFKITGFIDNLMTYSRNTSNVDGNMAHIDTMWYGRTRGRVDFIGEYGKSKFVLGLELDEVYGQTGSGNSNISTVQGGAVTNPVTGPVQTWFGTDGSFGLNTDVRGQLEVKWLYTEFELPFVPVPTVARLGAQPFGSLATYKLAVYAASDFAGASIVSTITPNVKLNWAFVSVEENLVGRSGGPQFGIPLQQLRGDDWSMILSPEVTPFKGLDIKPMYSYFTANGTTNSNARQGRGGINTSTAYTNPDGSWRNGINEDRHTIGVDARLRMGPFSLDPTVMYQFGHRDVVVPAGLLSQFSGQAPGSVARANLDAWLVDIRAGYQLGPLLLEAMYMFTSGNKANDTTLGKVRYYQTLTADTGYLADWGSQLTALGVDYLNAMMEAGAPIAYPGVAIGWDKYGRHQVGARATYAVTPALSAYFGANGHWTATEVDVNSTAVAGGGVLPTLSTFQNGSPSNGSHYIGTELFGGMTWRFAPGIAWDNAGGYMFVGKALDVTGQCLAGTTNCQTGPVNNSKDAYIVTSRIRFSF
jgi:hypothetical protein